MTGTLLQKGEPGLCGSNKAWKIGKGGDAASAFTAADGLSEGNVTEGKSAPKKRLGKDECRHAP